MLIPGLFLLAAMGSGATLGRAAPRHATGGGGLQPHAPGQVAAAWEHVALYLAPVLSRSQCDTRAQSGTRDTGVPLAKGQWDMAAEGRLGGRHPGPVAARLGASSSGPTQGCSHFPAVPHSLPLAQGITK